MKTFEKFISESKNFNLYHWVSTNKMIEIINDNTLYAKFKHTINNKEICGNSLSRNKKLKINYSYIRLTLDQEKLNYNYKIIPLDGEIIHKRIDIKDDYKINRHRDINPKKRNIFGDDPISKNFDEDRFDEEFLIGDIKNINKYIKEILIIKPKWYSEDFDLELINKIKEYCSNYNILFNDRKFKLKIIFYLKILISSFDISSNSSSSKYISSVSNDSLNDLVTAHFLSPNK